MNAIVVRGPTIFISSAKLMQDSRNHAFNSKFLTTRTALKCNCMKNEKTQNSFEVPSIFFFSFFFSTDFCYAGKCIHGFIYLFTY